MSRIRTVVVGTFALLSALPLATESCSSPPPLGDPSPVGSTAEAETDTFGLGSGRSGALTVPAANTVVNTYAAITAENANGRSVTIGALHGAATGFAADDLVLVWRTTGLAPVTSGVQTTITLNGDAAGYEFGRLKSVVGAVLTLTNPLTSTTRYATGSQVVRVPEYTTVNVPAARSIVPYAWDGSSGGIVAFLAQGMLTNDGTIDASGRGFRGGGIEDSAGNKGCTALDGWEGAGGAAGGGAHKGEGMVPTAFAVAILAMPGAGPAKSYGRGNYANGAGGGDCHNAGGGGGSNAGRGGGGGLTWNGDPLGGVACNEALTSCVGRPVGGLGGAALTYAVTTHLTLGGGGGAGEENNVHGTNGGSGGGVILARASSLAGAGVISADGANGGNDDLANGDALGGGGGGGTVALFFNGSSACSMLHANGGGGGSGAIDPDGTGGGGGGGFVTLQAATNACTGTATAGANGVIVNGNGFNGSPYGATAGSAGTTAITAMAFTGNCSPTSIANNQCGGCVVDADCPAAQPFCDTAKNSCGTCTPAKLTRCTGTTPACNTTPTNDVCTACNGNFGSATTHACPTAADPICETTGANAGACVVCNTSADCTGATTPVCTAAHTCVACNGDNGTAATDACPATTRPYCEANGSCGKCTTDANCVGNHAGPFCNVATGACGNTCTTDAECGSGNWCDNLAGPGVCAPKVANGQPVPGGTCTAPIGARACVSAVCDTDNDCGLENGDGPCTGSNGTTVCRSMVCATTGPSAGTCQGCTTDANCSGATPACNTMSNTCVPCTATNETACTGMTPLCDTTSNMCVPCGGDNGTSGPTACPSAMEPFCAMSGACGKCMSNGDCAGNHPGPICDPTSGACGNACQQDSDCNDPTEWCNAPPNGTGACVPKLANGVPLPSTPSNVSTCSAPVGLRVCTSGVCDPADNTCGLATGDGPCTTPGDCRSGVCEGTTCVAGDGGVADAGMMDGAADASANDASMNDASALQDANAFEDASPAQDAAMLDNGSVEGGGLSCAFSPRSQRGRTGDLIAIAFGLSVALARRRRQRT